MSGKSKWAVVIIACLAIFILVLDSSAMNVAIGALVEELHTSVSFIQAIIAVYALVLASFMLLGSKLQDILGRKRTFIVGTIIYGCGTLTAACSLNAWMLLVGWALLEGMGGAMMLPATTTLVSAEYTGKDRVAAFGIWGGIAATGAAVGPIVGGFFTTYLSWRLVFGSEVLFVLAILLLRNRLTESHPDLKWKDLDKTGSVLSVISLFLFVFGVLMLRTPDMWPVIPFLCIPGIALFVLFLYLQGRRSRRGLETLFDTSLLKKRAFNVGNLTNVVQQLALAGVLFVIPVFLQQVTKFSAMKTGLTLLPLSLSIFVFSILGGKFLSILRQPRYMAVAGFAISAVGFFLMRNDFSTSTQVNDLMPGFLVTGLGVGLLLSQLTNVTMSTASSEQEAGASGFLNTSKNLGYSLGTALIGVILILGVFHGLTTSLSTSPYVPPGTSQEQVKTDLIDYMETMQTSPPQTLIPDDQATAMVDDALSTGMKMSFDVMAVLMLLGMAVSFFLPKAETTAEVETGTAAGPDTA